MPRMIRPNMNTANYSLKEMKGKLRRDAPGAYQTVSETGGVMDSTKKKRKRILSASEEDKGQQRKI